MKIKAMRKYEMDKLVMKELIKKFGTPTFFFDEKILRDRIEYLRSRMPESVSLCYAVKANAFIIPYVAKLVERLEVCSPGEYDICKKYMISTSQMVISGVHKTKDYIQKIVTDDIGENGSCCAIYTIESLRHGMILEDVAREMGTTLQVLLRLSSGNQFGMDPIDIFEIAKYQIEKYPHLSVKGIQYFSGTQRRSMKKNAREIASVCEVMDRLRLDYGLKCEEFEYGTGFPVCYFQGEEFEEENFLKDFSEAFSLVASNYKVTLEIGRGIAASCGSYVTQVVDLKTVSKQNYAILDGGIHQLVYYGQTMAMRHPYYDLYSDEKQYSQTDEEIKNWNLCGSLCTTNDIVVKQLPIKGLKEGDFFVFHNTGAYSVTEGIALFLSRELPKVVLIKENGDAALVRDAVKTFTLNS